jgi:very-short-patch-repair endonuclease/rubredoxin
MNDFKCKDCDLSFPTKKGFKRHCKKTGHENHYLTQWTCKFCGIHIEKKFSRAAHIINCDLNPKSKEIRTKSSNSRKGSKLSVESRLKMSESRKRYLKENPDKNPFVIRNQNKLTYFERLLSDKLNEIGITGFLTNFSHGPYYYDLAFPTLKINIEVDGNTHNSEKRKNRDLIRDEWSISQGWRVLRIRNESVLYELDKVIEEILKLIGSENIPSLKILDSSELKKRLEIEKSERKKKRLEEKESRRENKFLIRDKEILEKIERVKTSNIDFSEFGWVNQVAKILDIRPQSVCRWMRINMEEFLKEKCFLKNRTKYTSDYKSNKDLIKEKVLNSGIDFSKVGWYFKLQTLTNNTKIRAWVRKNMPEFYEKECYKFRR